MLEEKFNELMCLFNEIKEEIRRRDKHLFEQWKAGGCAVDDGFVSMYPSLGEVVEQLGDEDEETDEEE